MCDAVCLGAPVAGVRKTSGKKSGSSGCHLTGVVDLRRASASCSDSRVRLFDQQLQLRVSAGQRRTRMMLQTSMKLPWTFDPHWKHSSRTASCVRLIPGAHLECVFLSLSLFKHEISFPFSSISTVQSAVRFLTWKAGECLLNLYHNL